MRKMVCLSVTKTVWKEIKDRKKLEMTTDDVLRNALGLPDRIKVTWDCYYPKTDNCKDCPKEEIACPLK